MALKKIMESQSQGNITSENLFQTILEHTTDAVIVADVSEVDYPDLHITYVNNAFLQLTGYKRDEVLNKTAHALNNSSETGRHHMDTMLNTLKLQRPADVELIIYKKDGDYFWANLSVFPVKDDFGNSIKWVGVLKDITKEKETEDRLAKVHRLAGIGNFAWDKSTGKVYFSQVAEELLESELSKNSEDAVAYVKDPKEAIWYVHDNHKRTLLNALIEARKSSDPFELDILITTELGKELWVRTVGEVEFVNGEPTRIYGTIQDIDQRKRAEIASEQNRKLLESITEKTNSPVHVRDENGKYFFANDQYKTLLGLQNTKIIGKHPRELLDENMAQLIESTDNYVKKYGKPVVFEEYLNTDSGKLYYQTNMFPLNGLPELGNAVGGISMEITAQKQLEDKLRHSVKEKETLLSEIHHRVKNNLAVVSSMMQLQAYKTEHADLRYQLEDSAGRIKTMSLIHEQLYQEKNFSELDLAQNIKTLATNIVETMKNSTEIKLDFRCQQINLPLNKAIPFFLIVNEVLTNSVKHAFVGREKGKIEIELVEKMGFISLRICDNGVGLSDVPKKGAESKSLGLNIIDVLSEQLEGEHNFDSYNGGCIFTLSFEKNHDANKN